MNPHEIEETASRVVKLSQNAMSENLPEAADELLRIAANLELMSPELQNCWGGPLNGQEGRRAIFRELIDVVGFDAIYETGTYRGLTTAWFSDHFSGPVYSCEIDKRYHYQAQSNLRCRSNVHLSLEDSRQFLRRNLAAATEGGRYLTYLDAHWHEDLPLAEEIQIAFDASQNCVIAIDDFKVPGDDYKFDDYGPAKVLSLDLLEQFKDESIRFFFPKLPASSETGAARGVCILTKGLSADVEKCGLLEGKSWLEWKQIESIHDASRANAPETPETESPNIQESEITPFQSDDISMLKAGIASLLESQSSLQRIVEDCTQMLNERLETIDDRREMGRALVEQKAKNLDLERQNYRLSEELRALAGQKLRNAELEQENLLLSEELRNPKVNQPREISRAMDEIVHIKNLVGSLSRSRMINLGSAIAPSARQTVAQIVGKLGTLDQIIHELNTK